MTGPGSISEEAAKLLAALGEWAADASANGIRIGDREHLATGAPECTHCPICQVVAVLRGDRPELTERLVEAGAAVAAAIRALLEPSAGPARPAPRVQKIDLDDPADSSP